jgi:hypothetical protein
LVQTEREVEALHVVVDTSIFEGEGVASEPLDWVLLRIVLGDPQRFEFLQEKQIAKPSREGGKPSFSPTMEDMLRRISSILRRAS